MHCERSIEKWDNVLPQVEFAFNNSTNRTTGYSSFEVAYGLKPKQPVDLIPLPTLAAPSKMVMHLHVIYEIYMKSPIFNVEDLCIHHGHHNDVSEELDLQSPPPLSSCPKIEYVLDDQLVSTR
ncbi:hypothetical protein CK203_054768 [Vitis vinifera]|uniref:Transposon Ty3-I Gag-Pol polyprotein n=1 Tax=Vitis vinifera TaxID=29760 RepID=A0A438GIP3_VITVI|nr:hypothetical protein CK203_054768 [Vitis vinifera]